MKTGWILSLIIAAVNLVLGFAGDILIGYDISLQMELIGIAYLIVWCWLNYKLYDGTEPVYKSGLYMSVPVIILFLGYVPLVRVLMINLPLLYTAPVFVIATTIAARFTLPITAGTVSVISILLMFAGACLGAGMKKSQMR